MEMLKHQRALKLLCSIPSIDVTAGASALAEIGSDMSAFPNSERICSWAGLSPGNYESAGQRKSAHINKGNPYLRGYIHTFKGLWRLFVHEKLQILTLSQKSGTRRFTNRHAIHGFLRKSRFAQLSEELIAQNKIFLWIRPLKSMLCEVAWVVAGKRDHYLSELRAYPKIRHLEEIVL